MKYFFTLCFLVSIFSLITAKNDPQCGTKGPLESKIIGGKEARPHEFPWMASFGRIEIGRKEKDKNSKFIYKSHCGGAIIHPQFILTAAHCYEIMEDEHIRATVGAHNVSLEAPELNRVSMPVAQFIEHPKFKYFQNSILYDVALVKLASPLDIGVNPDLGTICVPPQNDTYNPYLGQLVTAAGWGLTSWHGWFNPADSDSQVLLKVTLPIADMDWCKEMYNITEAENTMICTYQLDKDTCKGDSGGPLMKKMDDGRWTVVGITSWGKGCAGVDLPGMYSHVSLFSDWIWETVKANGG